MSRLVDGMDRYAAAKERFEARLGAALSEGFDGWHRLVVKVEDGVIVQANLELTESVKTANVTNGVDRTGCVVQT